MSSAKAQRQRILKLNIKDKKLCRLFHSKDIADKDILFLSYVYEERQHLHFRYGIVYTLFFSLIMRETLFKYSPTKFRNINTLFVCGTSHLFWSYLISKRFTLLTEPYFQKYQIK